MCETLNERHHSGMKTLPVSEAVGTVLAHDITEIRAGEFKGCAFRKGHIIKAEDVSHLQKLGKEHLYVLNVAENEIHEDDAAYRLATALMGDGVIMQGAPREGKINIIADRDGLLKINKSALLDFNMLGDIMCATTHNNSVVNKGGLVAGTRAIPLIVKKTIVEEAERLCKEAGGVISVKPLRKPKAGIVITGNEVYYGKVQDAFAPVIRKKIEAFGGEITGIYYAPDDQARIEERLRELLDAGADLLITTGGMSVDPDDITRFAIRKLGATDITYGSAVLPGAMFMVAYVQKAVGSQQSAVSSQAIPVLGIPACGMYHKTTVFDLVLPRILTGEHIGRRELAELGHGGLCLNCETCRYPICPFGKQ